MISKERLEELIKEKASVYYLQIEYYDGCSYGSRSLNLSNKYINQFGQLAIYNDGERYNIENLFETMEQLEIFMNAHLEFVGIKREEEFPYVSWEDFSGGLRIIEFVSFKHENIELSVLTISYETAYIQLFNSKTETMLFNKPATEENYYEALRLAKKLFLGEEITWIN